MLGCVTGRADPVLVCRACLLCCPIANVKVVSQPSSTASDGKHPLPNTVLYLLAKGDDAKDMKGGGVLAAQTRQMMINDKTRAAVALMSAKSRASAVQVCRAACRLMVPISSE